MKGTVLHLMPPAATAGQAEPLESAVLEVSARIATNSDERRLLFTRLDELRGSSPALRRRRPRVALSMPRPVTFYSIEEASPSGADTQGLTPLLAAGGAR